MLQREFTARSSAQACMWRIVGFMDAVGENGALEQVVARLRVRFPKLSAEYVRRVVHGERDRLVRGTGRELVAVQVEDAATEELRKEADPVRLRPEHGSR